MKPYDTVLFDLDGTLLNTLLGLTSALTHVFLAHHFPTPETVRYGLGYGYIGLMERTLPEESPALHAQLAQEFNEWYSSHCLVATHPYDGIIDVLTHIKDNAIKTAIVSNKGAVAAKALYEHFFCTVRRLFPWPVAKLSQKAGSRYGMRRSRQARQYQKPRLICRRL